MADGENLTGLLRLQLRHLVDGWSAIAPTFPSPFAAAGAASDYRAGFTVGLGLEWAFAGNWSAKIEYDYMNFGSKTVTFNNVAVVNSFFPPALVSATPVSVTIYQQMSVVKLGINYRFLSSI